MDQVTAGNVPVDVEFAFPMVDHVVPPSSECSRIIELEDDIGPPVIVVRLPVMFVEPPREITAGSSLIVSDVAVGYFTL